MVLRSLETQTSLAALEAARAFAAHGQAASRKVAEAKIGAGRQVQLLAALVASLPSLDSPHIVEHAVVERSVLAGSGVLEEVQGSGGSRSYPLLLDESSLESREARKQSTRDQAVQHLAFVALRGPDRCSRAAIAGLRRLGAGGESVSVALNSYGLARLGDGASALLTGASGSDWSSRALRAYLSSCASVLSVIGACLDFEKIPAAEGQWDQLIPQVQGILLRVLVHNRTASEAEMEATKMRFPQVGPAEAAVLCDTASRSA